MVSGTQPDSPWPPTRWRAHYAQPEPVEFDVEFPDDIDGPEDFCQFLLDAAPFSREAAVRVEPAERGAGSAAPGRTGSALPESGGESGQNDSGDLSGSVWRVGRSWGRTIVLQAGDQPAKAAGGDKLIGVMDTPELARIVVDAVNARRVSVDDDTVERVAQAMWLVDIRRLPGTHGANWETNAPDDAKAYFRAQARAAVQALRGGDND